ncbi:YajQ family cyclic di-GMP-binding protein [Motilimonas pumila]|uniref:Nucleotide-binding protein D1Z90_02035 n=1 Tax=Motilimonas pumila TaxID=2303987 RepID=A0A418YKM7_9GAMM|nr:YajQ family cyclic di-GMP-binding protein [Motilimonas pumila]RJG51534.1 YajQ family cyclic di-GMP-binding protein [Motilimonas pumila]
MPSFDIVSEVDAVELKNAVDNANRELDTRFDFRGVEASFEKKEFNVKVAAENDFQLKQMLDMLRLCLAKRNVDAASMEAGEPIHTGKTWHLDATFKQGIDSLTAKKVVKTIKESKIKVQAQIQGEQVRVTGKKRDDLQAVMRLVKEAELGQPFQFNNFRD